MSPPSTPAYQAPSRARAGVAMAVDASATAMASLRIIVPFHVRSKIELRAHYESAGWRARSGLRPAVAKKPQFGRSILARHCVRFVFTFQSNRADALRRGFDRSLNGPENRPWPRLPA